MSNVKDTQSRKWMLVINNPEDHGLTKDKIIEHRMHALLLVQSQKIVKYRNIFKSGTSV